jgi:hypothetical protein
MLLVKQFQTEKYYIADSKNKLIKNDEKTVNRNAFAHTDFSNSTKKSEFGPYTTYGMEQLE